MCVPALDLLGRAHRLTLVGKPWAAALFAAYPWPVVPLTGHWWTQLTQLRTWVHAQAAGRTPAVLMTNSFGSALQLRLAGLAPIGYATEQRRALLARALPVPPRWAGEMHTVEYYATLAAAALNQSLPAVPARLRLNIDDAARARALALLHNAGVDGAYVVLCPVAVGLHRGQVKAWSGFARLAAALHARGVALVALPGPGERDAVRLAAPQATLLPAADVGTFAAVLAGSTLVIANDSGPGHVAAAVGARLISVFGVTDPLKTRPWGPDVTLLGGAAGWPSYDEVESAVLAALG